VAHDAERVYRWLREPYINTCHYLFSTSKNKH
jgi:hypothetical protein